MAGNKAQRSPSSPRSPSAPPKETEAVLTAVAERRKPVIRKRYNSWRRCGEVAGAAAASCAALCCCCPAVVFDVLLTVTVWVPVALCRRARKALAKRKERARRRKETRTDGGDSANAEAEADVALAVTGVTAETMPAEKIKEVEKEMLALFRNTGFWRSPSQTEDCR